jgi:DNA-binding transcriptional LysR family regulator
MNRLPWEDLRVFLAVAETRGMSAAARQLRVGQPTVSRRLAALEAELGYALFRRSVAGVTLTAAGERLVAPARKMAEWAAEVDRAARAQERRPRGVVRVTAPPGLAWDYLVPFAAWLKQKQPGLQLELLSTVHYLDLARGEADLALRLRAETTADLTTVASLSHAVHAVAARPLVAKLPRRYGFHDVPWIGWAPPLDRLPPNPQLQELVPDLAFAFTSDNYLVQLRAAEMGLGAMVLGELRHRFSRPTTLVPLKLALGPYTRSSLHLVCAKSALEIARVRIVAELLAAELARLDAA